MGIFNLINQYHFHNKVYEKMEFFRENLVKEIILQKIPNVDFLKTFGFHNLLKNYFTIYYSKYKNPKLDRPTLFVGDILKIKFSLNEDPSKFYESEVVINNPDSFLKQEYIQFLNKFNLKSHDNLAYINKPTTLFIELLDPLTIPITESNSFFNFCLVNFLNHYFGVCVNQARIFNAKSKSQSYEDPEDPERLLVNLFIQILDEQKPFPEHLELALNFFTNSPKKTAKYKKVKEILELVYKTKDCGYFLNNYQEVINEK